MQKSFIPIELDEKELQLVKLICKNYSHRVISVMLGKTENEVKELEQEIIRKIGAKNEVGIAIYAIKNKIVTP